MHKCKIWKKDILWGWRSLSKFVSGGRCALTDGGDQLFWVLCGAYSESCWMEDLLYSWQELNVGQWEWSDGNGWRNFLSFCRFGESAQRQVCETELVFGRGLGTEYNGKWICCGDKLWVRVCCIPKIRISAHLFLILELCRIWVSQVLF